MIDKERQHIFDCLGRLLATADRDQESIQALINELRQQIDNYDSQQRRFKEDIQGVIYRSVNSSIKNSSKHVEDGFRDVERLAQLAAEKYENYSRWAIWKVMLSGALFFTVLSAMVFAFFFYYLPTPNKISALKEKQRAYVEHIKYLESEGALAKIDKCNGRLCVRINKQEISNKFKGNSGGAYLIIDGY